MASLLHRLRRIARKLRLRLVLAWRFATGFDDALPRCTCKVSYSQSGEDMIVWFIFHLLGQGKPSYLDVGAHHPTYLNNTALFSFLGATGMNIEPDPVLFPEFPRLRPRDINLNIGIAEAAGELTFFRLSDPTLNTFSPQEAERMVRQGRATIVARDSLRVEPISAVLDRWKFSPDFLSIDTEGRDLAILRTYDFVRHRPTVVCAETLMSALEGTERKNTALIDFLAGQGFRVYADTYINTIFVDERRLHA
jgi:FkbM family methyltransferase